MIAPTLLIGLGGTGSKIIARVANMVTEKEREHIAFAVFDTDINELRDIQQKTPFIHTIQTSTKQTVGEYLNKDTRSRDSWFPVNAILNGKTLTEGAGQVRSISRLALDTVIRAGKMEPLHAAIQSLYKVEEDKVDQAMRVVIVSSLAGGTGSGLILPVALYTRHYLATHFRLSANITRGFFILPEVFYEVIPGQSERNNLKANAYATLRELDAFLMKGDDTLPEKYRDSVRMEFPNPTSSTYEEYPERPYDFCFLFDAQNADGSKLNSFDQYLDHAANCIYAQSIGPMNKRSNSSEDNTIRKLAKERGRNRYAGAGASMLIYPYEDIKTYIALNWAKGSVSKEWLKYDEMYKNLIRENNRQREAGITANPPTAEDQYIANINAMADHDAFSRAIVDACTIFSSDGYTRVGQKWNTYVQAIDAYTKSVAEQGNETLSADEEDIKLSTGNLGSPDAEKGWGPYIQLYYSLMSYYMKTKAYVGEKSPALGYSLFRGSNGSALSDPNDPTRLEKYLADDKGKFLHPNAARYMLINILNLMINTQKQAAQLRDKALETIQGFENNHFKVKDDEPGNAEIFGTTKASKGDQDSMEQNLSDLHRTINQYRTQAMLATVYENGIAYITSLIKAYDGFFKTFDSKVEGVNDSIRAIYAKYNDRMGSTTRYVCVSQKCLDTMMHNMVYTQSAITIDPELAKSIHRRINDYALMTEKPNRSRYFGDLFDTNIIGFFKQAVEDSYGLELNIDIIEALKKEAYYVSYDPESEEGSSVDTKLYIQRVIEDTRKLSCPFIETPLGETRDPIFSCAFNDDLKPDRGDESEDANLIRELLMNRGGAADSDISKYMIMFYQAYYGLRANNLSKFAPKEESATYDRPCGEYFNAYYDLVSGIHPDTSRSPEISPHIDKWWHIITKMPDLDEKNQVVQENGINAAFFWGILLKYVGLHEESRGKWVYNIDMDALRMNESTLIVSNGTPCDKLYEVLDSIAIYPALCRKILEKVESQITDDINKDRKLEDGMLFRALGKLKFQEPRIGKESKQAESIFSLPMLMQKSCISEEYYEDNVISILNVELSEIHRYLTKFCSEKELPDVMHALIMEQFEKYLTDVEEEAKANDKIYGETLFGRTCAIISSYLYDLDFTDDAREIKEKANDLKDMANEAAKAK